MSLSYAGVPLILGTPDITEWIERNLSLNDVFEFATQTWPGGRLTTHTFQSYGPIRPIKVGSLWWPTGARRFAIGSFLCTGSQLDQIVAKVYTQSGALRVPVAQILHMDSGSDNIDVPMFCLPARPLGGLDGETETTLWLLTLVDDRYFWSEREGTTATLSTGSAGSSTAGIGK